MMPPLLDKLLLESYNVLVRFLFQIAYLILLPLSEILVFCSQVEDSSAQCVSNLSRIDSVKHHMEAARDTLQVSNVSQSCLCSPMA